MRITELQITRWRNLRGLTLEVPNDVNLIALVGENGSGKTNVLELLSYAAFRLGLAPAQRQAQRQLPPLEADVSVTVDLSSVPLDPDELAPRFPGPGTPERVRELLAAWDGSLEFRMFGHVPSEAERPGWFPPGTTEAVIAGGEMAPETRLELATGLVGHLQTHGEINHLFLDADRAYGPLTVQDAEILEAARTDPNEPTRMRQAAVLVSANQYIEWVRAWLGMSQREALEFRDQHQTASLNNEQGPEYSDQFAEYRESVRAVLPHLLFLRPDQAQRSLLFKSAGEELRYEELSGGEREVAFLLGQMHRFPLRRGLLLLDEPELHLNAELLRRWLAHVRDNAGEGQVWIATHAMEAAEVAGQDATIVLERAPDGVVREAAPLGDRPVLQTLARALGSPAFSLSSSRYVLIEGAKPTERARFASLSPGLENRFLESGGCEEVVDKLNAVLTFARETDQLRIGAVIDRDHRTPSQIRQLVGELPVHVLAVFEIENFFLYPPALALIAQRAHLGAEAATVALQEASDRFAGLLIAERVATRENLQLSKSIRDVGAAITWSELAEDSSSRIEQLREAFEMAGAQPSDLVANLGSAVDFYATLRSSEELWKKCMGKEIMGVLPAELGISKARYLESQVIRMYEENEITPPDELIALRDYVAAIPYAA